MATLKVTRFLSYFKGFCTRCPTRVWHFIVLSLSSLFQKSRHLLSWKRRRQERKAQLCAEKKARWRELSLALDEGRLTVEMMDDIDVLEALMWLEEEKRTRKCDETITSPLVGEVALKGRVRGFIG